MTKKGILLVNLGTPDKPTTISVAKYLNEFLMDERVIDIHPVLRAILVKALIIPFRSSRSAKLYQKIWRTDGTSPLSYYTEQQTRLLRDELGEGYVVEMAMRYQNPSIKKALHKLKAANVVSIKVIPLFPQYASATTGSVHQEVMRVISKWHTMPDLSFVNSFYDSLLMIGAFSDNLIKCGIEDFDHILFSFHGLPQSQLRKSAQTQGQCLKKGNCCSKLNSTNSLCYSAQCHNTAKLIAAQANIPEIKYTVCFQSRLGKAKWAQPYASDVLRNLAGKNVKRVLVVCPSFVSDCLETLYEIRHEYRELFLHMGGEELLLANGLNTHSQWIKAVHAIAPC